MIISLLLKIPAITLIASLILIVPIIIGTINIKTLKRTPLIIIFVYLVVYSFFEIIAWYYALNGLQNHFLGNLVTYLDVLSFGCFYYYIISDIRHRQIVLLVIFITILIILWSHFGTNRDFNRIDSFALSIQNISIIIITLLYFYQLLNHLETKNLFTYSNFWISIGVLIHFSVIFFMDIFAEYITFNQDKSITQYWLIKEYLTIFHRIFLAIGLWFSTTPIQSNLSSK